MYGENKEGLGILKVETSSHLKKEESTNFCGFFFVVFCPFATRRAGTVDGKDTLMLAFLIALN